MSRTSMEVNHLTNEEDMKNSFYKYCALFLVAIAALTSGCSKTGSAEQSASKDNDKVQSAEQTTAALPIAKSDTPLDQYTKLTSGKQLMYMYLGMLNAPVDYENIARGISDEYNSTNDAFKKKDIVNALKPDIDSEIAKAKNIRYFVIEDEAGLSSYDFAAKGFSVQNAMLQDPPPDMSGESARVHTIGYVPPRRPDDTTGYFADNNFTSYGYSNHKDFSMLKVADEAKAREIEALSKKSNSNFKMLIYAYAQGIAPGFHYIKFQIVKIKLLDAKGNELLTQ